MLRGAGRGLRLRRGGSAGAGAGPGRPRCCRRSSGSRGSGACVRSPGGGCRAGPRTAANGSRSCARWSWPRRVRCRHVSGLGLGAGSTVAVPPLPGWRAAMDAVSIAARQPGSGGTATVDPRPGQALTRADTALAAAKDASRETPSHLPLSAVRPGSRLLETERKLLTHAIRMSAYNTESALARLLRPHYPRGEDEGRALLREAFTLTGDL